ncbi:MAG: TonB family protein [Sulfuricurvum sp.]|nr:TonB family protein [Sulfuricurvum sp.]
MKKSLFLSALLHLVLIAIFFFFPLAVDLSKKSKAIELTFGPPDTTSQKIASEEKESKPSVKSAPISPEPEKTTDNEITQAPAKPKSEVSNLPAEIPADIMPPVKSSAPAQPTSTIEPTQASMPNAPMQKSAYSLPEASPEIYGSMGLNSYYYNKPTEAFSPLHTTKSPAKKLQQQYIMKHSMQSSPRIPMQKPSMILTETVPTMTLSIIKNMSRETTPLDTAPITAEILNSEPNTVKSYGEEIFSAQQAYMQGIQQAIEKYKVYPQEAEEGTVKIKFRIGNDGTVIKMEIIESSGSETLDAAGAVLVKKIVKFQPIPDILKKEFMDIMLNINYK